MQRHPFSSDFIAAAAHEVRELEKKQTFAWINQSEATKRQLPLKWVFKYKFDTDGYLVKFKARLCVRGDL